MFENRHAFLADGGSVHHERVKRLLLKAVAGAGGVCGNQHAEAHLLELLANRVLVLGLRLDDEHGARPCRGAVAGSAAFDLAANFAYRLQKLRRRLVTLLRVERHHCFQDMEKGWRTVYLVATQRLNIIKTLLLHPGAPVLGHDQRRPAREHLVEHAT